MQSSQNWNYASDTGCQYGKRWLHLLHHVPGHTGTIFKGEHHVLPNKDAEGVQPVGMPPHSLSNLENCMLSNALL